MLKKIKTSVPNRVLDDTRILLLTDDDMDRILGGFQEPEHTVLPACPYPWENPANRDVLENPHL